MRCNPTTGAFDISIPWKQPLQSLHGISALIPIRSIFRIVEYAMGNEGYPLSDEWKLYVFDSVPMLIRMVVLGVCYSRDLKSSGSTYL